MQDEEDLQSVCASVSLTDGLDDHRVHFVGTELELVARETAGRQ